MFGFAGQLVDGDVELGGDALEQGSAHLTLVGLDQVEIARRDIDAARQRRLGEALGLAACADPEPDGRAHEPSLVKSLTG